MSEWAWTTKARLLVNAILKPLGLELITTKWQREETARLKKLKAQGHWSFPRYTEGLRFDEERYLEFLREICLPYRSRYALFQKKAVYGDERFFLDNGWFGPVDAEVLYSVVRHFKPSQIIEIGSGFSTRLIRMAIKEDNLKTRLTCIDPSPRREIQSFADEHIPLPVEDLTPSKIWTALSAQDLLFIDSSHVVTTGGDIPYLYLEILPRLRSGVFIHVHDIFLPFDYPEPWTAEFRWGWTEQYLVHAFLCANTDFEIVWPSRYMWEYCKEEILHAFPSARDLSLPPASFWLRKVR